MMTVELGWKPRHSFEQGLKAMARWYFDHIEWGQQVCDRNSDCGRSDRRYKCSCRGF